ncbi:ABC transporter ATP-binding protein [Candidatus Methanoperedens nitratireducens]|uniref:Outer membrane-specific lipoprotein transporter subunit ATP-binding component of ABC superfamily n=1 Tax=Candidatus Methanoperedens nitratireducens TaxID=1392998 RepID=A0A284VSJ0_9EURY|nr:ABC transporter ATP-binding protein [Candidatus Methanoperedens nitroreducens]SNQ62179.1 outer membrane-specific lipoprotein transporter subunit; ATP-binding component of ABC superfamily [Candidatus Methanoperedens nitroreducens]
MIELKNIRKIYYMGKIEVPALRGVDLDIGRGEFVALMGPSGSGKSTLLNMMGLLDAPTSGSIFIDGSDVSSLNENERADFRLRKLGFVFQFFSLLMELSALENVALPMIMDNRKYDRAASLLELVGLGDRADHTPNELSGGQQQRVAIARALANEPAILLADEPTANLDTESSNQIVQLFRELNEQRGQTIIMVTHEPDLGEKADRIVRLKDGRVVT